MSFVLRPVDGTFISRLVNDALPGSALQRQLSSLSDQRHFYWGSLAIDKSEDCYLVRKPQSIREENTRNTYLFRFDGSLLQAEMPSIFSNEVYFVNRPSTARLTAAQHMLAQAFSAFELRGPDLVSPFVPKFVEGP